VTWVSQFVDEAVEAYRALLEAAVEDLGAARSPAEFCEAERRVVSLTQQMAGALTQGALQQACDDPERVSEAVARIRERASRRGLQLRHERDRPTSVRTLSGEVVKVVTPYYTARPRSDRPLKKRGAQGTGVYPVLDQLGIAGRSTPAVRLLVARAVCEANSVASARDLLSAGGVEVGHKTALRLTYMVSDDALRTRKRRVAAVQSGDDEGEFVGRRVVVTVDGGRINIRRRLGGRPKKGGRKRFETDWREPKVLTVYVLNEDGRRDKSISSVIDGTLGDADAVFQLIRYHLFRLGAHKALDVTLVADGALWIWNRAGELREVLGLPEERFHEIVDYFHAVERLGDFSKAQEGWREEFRRLWLAEQKKRLKAGDIEHLESVFRVIAKECSAEPKTEQDRKRKKALETEQAYWKRNRERLRFAAFRTRGLPNGSGVVESSVRRVINLRLKGASINWLEEHAEGVLHLRAHAKSGRWDELEAAVFESTGWRPAARQPRAPP